MLSKSNIFAQIPNSLKEELFEDIISTENIKIERIVSDAHTSPKEGWHESQKNEWVIILEGDAVLTFENSEDIILKRGDYYNVTAFTKHRVSHTSKNEKTIWLAIYY